nr:hypothetical protein [uncultured Butyrivibrio sp.]
MVVVIKPIDTLKGTIDYICTELRKCIHLQEGKEAKINLSLDLTKPEYILVKRETEMFRFYLKWYRNGNFISFYVSENEERMIGHVTEMVAGMAAVYEKEQLEQKCYEAYKLDWMMSHGYSLDDLYRAMLKYEKEMFDPEDFIEDGEERSFDFDESDLERSAMQARDILLYEQGFGSGSIWACKNEFLDHEYRDADYMRSLFGRMRDGKKLKEQYERFYRRGNVA